jgi:hypothetical protein
MSAVDPKRNLALLPAFPAETDDKGMKSEYPMETVRQHSIDYVLDNGEC